MSFWHPKVVERYALLGGLSRLYIDDTVIADRSITAKKKLKLRSITDDVIADEGITGSKKLKLRSITDDVIADEGITGSTKIKSGSITRDRLEKSLLVGTVTIDPPSIVAGSTANVDVTVSGLTTSHKVLVMCQSDLEHGLIPIAAYVPSANTLRVRITNFTGSAIDGAARTWFYIAWIP